MQQTADEAGLELNMEIPGAHNSTINVASGEQDELSQRLAQLRQT
jgi:charged multivesicular body protein 1